ncbi:MAG: right-handed parallel beta-helix repeat-containing protein [Thermoplasmata archaeon]|nr:right-handed parallel beta-helix repeat-containing protein [Thermoplasmata archaeon]
MRKSILMALLVFMSMFTVVMILPETARATTLFVGGTGPGNYTTIQAAIDAAVPGDTVYVYNETYYEHVALNKTLSLVGEDRNATVLDGSGTGVPLNVTADWVNVTGFNFTNSGTDWEDAGLELYSAHNCNISHNIFQDSMEHIGLLLSDNNTITYNEVLGPFNGIVVSQSSDNTIVRNTVYSNGNIGIYVPWGDSNTISNNTVVGNDDGIMLGGWANHTLVAGNNISSNGRYGLALWGASYSTVHNNIMLRNGWGTYRYGIYLWDAENNTISHNEVHESASINIYLNYSNNNTVEGNNVSDSHYGVNLHNSDSNNVVRTKALANSYAGVYIWRLSNHNMISDSEISGSSFGVYFGGADNNTISDSRTSNNEAGIYLDASDFSQILNCTVLSNGGGISVRESYNTTIRESNVSLSDSMGLYVTSSNNTLISNNTVLQNGHDGIGIYFSGDGEITNNTLSSNWASGIGLSYSERVTIHDNVLVDDGIGIGGNRLSDFNSHVISTTNAANGKPIRYWKNVTGGIVPADAGQVILANCTGVRVENQNISDADYGVQLGVSSGNIVRANNVSSNDWYGISLTYSYANSVENNTANGNRQGLRLHHSNGNAVTGSNASWNSWDGIHLYESDGNALSSNNFSFNDVGIDLYWSSADILSDNVMFEDGILIWGSSIEHWNTHDIDTTNTVNGNPVHYWKNATGGSVPSDAGEVILANCSNVSVGGQNVNNGSVGILLGFSANNDIAGNTASSNKLYGVHMYRSDLNTLSDNNISYNQWGIHLYSSVQNTIARNEVYRNKMGMGIRADSNNNTVDLNIVSESQQYGIGTSYSRDNIIVGNDVLRNRQGISISMSSGTRVYHNNIIDNTFQAGDNTDSNQWDDGYPSGGNYWSDYAGVDVMSGPDQDQPGSDGIGDTPYNVDADTQDRYPLMDPFGVPRTRPPKVLDAVLSGADFENVTISWALSPDDGLGLNSVVGYHILRNTTYDRSGFDYQLISTLPNGTNSFVDTYAGEGDPNDYFYIICALDSNNTTSCSEDQAGKFTRPLLTGPNLVSIPLVQSDTRVENVLQTATFDMTWTYRPYDPNDKWKYYMPFKPYKGDLSWLNHTQGFWINATEECNLTVAGLVPLRTSIQLYSGWNLVGFPSFDASFMLSDLRASVAVDRAEAFDPSAPPHFLRIMQDSDEFSAGDGYWVKVTGDTLWMVDV